ncbi:FkbM family methyltransferase [Burkholderia glumae]|uniref:FkbM family methyltransferase n=1 Tax=Burkholderia glumae TaxID=337 RepID=A0AAP9Y324_BURGL|nr:FkbM family methyltransferase [Burkholderia glumae]ACR28786.1 Methyltransferase FkbM family [Burkholderia glumae BGR1]AJY65562.1 methyltransferase, FkbM family domain protein [Burkholderia glumae LMG 2196 = ATCC 33617]KHJ62704.1 FkbM family methyltransferase [Burkholderia glumae]MCM2483339.1 FkbM family methyltransferase [Burkholderia glumae]MCM2493130.1 FkbM family methyltransferase [Burkholderia glumae]
MAFPNRPIAFVLAASNHGTMIVNRHDHNTAVEGYTYGVGHQILQNGCFDASEIGFVLAMLTRRRELHGDGIVAIDGGANIGVHTIEWARHMHGWGRVLSFEAQEIVFYALAGNIVLNNCLNARAKLAALGERCGELVIPQPDYLSQASFGSLELRRRDGNEFIGQVISYDTAAGTTVPMVSIDSLGLARVDLIKLDIEGMELEALTGARDTLRRCRPMLTIEVLKTDPVLVERFLDEFGYRCVPAGLNMIAVHRDDPVSPHLQQGDGVVYIS